MGNSLRISIDEANNLTGEYANTVLFTLADIPLIEIDAWPSQYDPCPKGWHIPSKLEGQSMADKINKENNTWDSLSYQLILDGNKDKEKMYVFRIYYLEPMNFNKNSDKASFFISEWKSPFMLLEGKSVGETYTLDYRIVEKSAPDDFLRPIRCVMDTPTP